MARRLVGAGAGMALGAAVLLAAAGCGRGGGVAASPGAGGGDTVAAPPAGGGGDVTTPPPGAGGGDASAPSGGGGGGAVPPSSDVTTSVPAAAEFPGLAALRSETARLLRFWMFDRFFQDHGVGPFVYQGFRKTLLEKAQPDECFNGIGAQSTLPPCSPPSLPKVNDAYIWGLAKSSGSLYFGTISNTLCLVDASYLGMTEAHQTSEFVCEFGERTPENSPPGLVIPGMPGDFRPANLFRYDEVTGDLVSLNPVGNPAADALRKATIGFRSAGALGDTVFIAGPFGRGGISMFAFDGPTGALLGASVVNNAANVYTNVRQWAVANGALYVGVGTANGGAILRWSGSRDELFRFDEVGHLPSDAANMTVHDDGRIYVTTWPSRTSPAGLYRSPVVGPDGLTAADADADDWKTPLWLATQYDPDPVVAQSYGGGAIASYRGKLVFGTMHVPMTALQAAYEVYPLADGNGAQNFLGTTRPIAIFQVAFPDGQPKVELLYGEKYLPKYDPATQAFTIRYDAAHRTGSFVPKMGPSGFGNFYNSYTWSMAEYEGQLFIGTFDWSQVARLMSSVFVGDSNEVDPASIDIMLRLLRGFNKEGADVVRLLPFGGALMESNSGAGNDRNYGIRNMIVDNGTLYLGTANPMNLDAKGGWELIQVTR